MPLLTRLVGLRIAFVLLGLLVPVLGLELLLRCLPVSDATVPMLVNVESPTARHRPNRDVLWSRGWNFELVTRKHFNNYGQTSDLDYDPADRRPLAVLIGDSFVEALQVSNADSMTGLLQASLAPDARLYAFGMMGDALSTYLERAIWLDNLFRPDTAIFVLIANDFDESDFRYRSAPGKSYFVPPEMTLHRVDYTGPSVAVNVYRRSALARYLLKTVGIQAAFERRAMRQRVGDTLDPQRIADSEQVVDAFFDQLEQRTRFGPGHALFVLDAPPELIYGQPTATAGGYFVHMRDYFMKRCRELGFDYVDMAPVFSGDYSTHGEKFSFRLDAHWNELGHFLAAKAILASKLGTRIVDGAVIDRQRPAGHVF